MLSIGSGSKAFFQLSGCVFFILFTCTLAIAPLTLATQYQSVRELSSSQMQAVARKTVQVEKLSREIAKLQNGVDSLQDFFGSENNVRAHATNAGVDRSLDLFKGYLNLRVHGKVEQRELISALKSIQAIENTSWNMLLVCCVASLLSLITVGYFNLDRVWRPVATATDVLPGASDNTVQHVSTAFEQRDRNGRVRVKEFEELYGTLDDSIETMISALRLLADSAQGNAQKSKSASIDLAACDKISRDKKIAV